MTSLAERLDQHVAERRRFGGDWASQARQVRPFVAFADGEGAEWITTALFLRWRERFGNANRETWAQRLSAVRVFAEWLQGIDPRTEVPPKGLIPHRGCRPKPYIYSDGEISRIVAEAARLKCSTGLRASTCSTMFGLMAVTGMRIGEALKLHDGDVDTDGGTVRVGTASSRSPTARPNAFKRTATPATASSAARRRHSSAGRAATACVQTPPGTTSPRSVSGSACGSRGATAGRGADRAFMIFGTASPQKPSPTGSGRVWTSMPRCTSSVPSSAMRAPTAPTVILSSGLQ